MRHFKRISLIVILSIFAFSLSLSALNISSVSAQDVIATTKSTVRMRNKPLNSGKVLASIPQDTALPALATDLGRLWVKVNFNGQIGWISTRFVTWTGDYKTLPVDNSKAATDAGVATPTPAPTTASGGATVNTNFGADAIVVKAIRNASVLATPVRTATILVIIPTGTQVQALAINAKKTYVQVKFNDITGWTLIGNLKAVQGKIAALPVTANTAAPTATPIATTAPAPRIVFNVTPGAGYETGIPNTVKPNGCVDVSWDVEFIDQVFLVIGGNETGVVGRAERRASEGGEMCIPAGQSRYYGLKIRLLDGTFTTTGVTINSQP